MTPGEFTSALDTLGLSIDAFADRAGVHRTTVYRWLREGDIPKLAAWLVALLLERKQIVDMVAKEI